MDRRLLHAYEEELTYLRKTALEFGEENEAVAGQLGLNRGMEPDPYVERLLEGVAFLAARVQLKLQDQYPEFTQHLLAAIQPHYLTPTPAICVAGFEPQEGDQAIVGGYPVPRLTELSASIAEQDGAVITFRTGHDVTLWPLKITEAEYLPTRAAVAPFAAAADARVEAGLRVRFAGTGGAPLAKIAPPFLPLYLDGRGTLPGELYRQFIGDTLAVVARPAGSAAGSEGWTRLPPPAQYGFDDDCALLPAHGRVFPGYRLLTEYFACPERFLFVALGELEKAFSRCAAACDVVFLFERSAPALAGAVNPANLRLFATPAINLFEKQLGRVPVKPFGHEYQLIADRTRPLDFEVHSLLDVVAYSRSNTDARPVAPLYAFGALLYDWREALFYVARLAQRRMSTKERRLRKRSDYLGTETWISLTCPGDPDRIDDVHELAIRALVTNRELPDQVRLGGPTDLKTTGAPVRSITILREPTRPLPAMGLGDEAWRLIGHLTPNYATLAPNDHDDPSLLRDHLALYGRKDDPLMRRQIDGILSVRSEPVTRRVPRQLRAAMAEGRPDRGWEGLALARGLRIRLRLDDASFENAAMFLFAAVLERFMAEFATVNSFCQCEFESQSEGEFVQWPPRMGLRRNI